METLFEQLMIFALKHRASDLHFETHDGITKTEIRTKEGFLKINKNNQITDLVEFIKYHANLDLSNSLTPQTGSFNYILQGREYFFRVALINSLSTQICVLRILNQTYALKIGLNLKLIFRKISQEKNGIILFSGVTGSGKTTSMYNLLHNFSDKKIYTIEDPVEIYFETLVQLQVNKEQGLSYDQAISQVLRHDPDVIVIGEIRSQKEAEMAFRAALTGHLVISTIHASSAKLTINRLVDLGISEYNCLNTIKYIIHQDLSTTKGRFCEYSILSQKDLLKINS